MKIIFAQGNPGKQYERTRHNVGFMVLDALAAAHATDWKTETKFKADLATIQLGDEKVLLVKPLSYYNETGQAARALVDFYKIEPARDFLVIHDELALPFGTIRVRDKGSDAGNNGIKSLNSHLGSSYTRIRIGIWNELRDQIDDAAFVLSPFTSKEAVDLKSIVDTIVTSLIHTFIEGGLESSSHKAP